MKKLSLILIAIILMVSVMGVSVSANEKIDHTKFNVDCSTVPSSPVDVVLTLENYFEVTLPTIFTFADGNSDSEYTTYDDLVLVVGRLGVGEKINVSVKSDNYSTTTNNNKYWNLTKSDDSTKVYNYVMGITESSTVHIGENTPLVASGDVILSNSTSQTVFVHLKLIPKESELDMTGSYNDKLTFTVELVKPTTP